MNGRPVRWCGRLHCCSRHYRTWEGHLFLETSAMRLFLCMRSVWAFLSHAYLRTVNVLKQLSCSGALQIYEMQKNMEFCLCPYFQLIVGPVTFSCPISHMNSKRSPPKAPIIISLSYRYMCKHTETFIFEWQQPLLRVIAVYCSL